MDKPTFAYTSYIAAPPEDVWRALTTPEFTRQYWGARDIRSEWTAGARVVMTKSDGSIDWEGTVLEAAPPRRLSYTFFTPGDPTPTRVTFSIEREGPQSKLTVTHTDFPAGEAGLKYLAGVTRGWQAILSGLKTLLETGKPLVFEAWA